MKAQSRNEVLEAVAIEWLTLLRSSTVTTQQQDQFFEWLQSDPAHQQAFVAADALWQRGAALSRVKRSRVKRSGDFSLFRKSANLLWGGSVVACLLLAFVYFVVFPQAPQQYQRYETLAAERKTVELEDGSRIILNAGSQLNFWVAKHQRNAELQGEAFFDVSHDSARPFIIATEHGRVEVLGTKFSVSSAPLNTEVIVLEGRVRVTPKPRSQSQSQSQDLVANQQLIIERGAMRMQSVDATRSLSWREGFLRFEGSPLSAVLEHLSEYYQESIVIEDDSLKPIKVVAVLPLDKSLDQNLTTLSSSLDLSFSKLDGERRIGPK